MKIEELITELERLSLVLDRDDDGDDSHVRADAALLKYIGNARVSELHEKLAVYYS